MRDWLYVDDHCEACAWCSSAAAPGETYNIGGDCEKANIDVVRTICALLDEASPRKGGKYAELISFVKDRPGHDRRYAMDASKIRARAGLAPARRPSSRAWQRR